MKQGWAQTVSVAWGLVFALALASPALAAPEVIKLWPGKAPGEQGPVPAEEATKSAEGVVTRITNVSEPTLSVYPAPKEKATGTAVVVAPGGGYNMLAWDHEGEQIARWFNDAGVAAFILKYRVPRRSHDPETLLPLADAQRAISIVRSRGKEWNVDPARVGIVGFSAGGHLAAHAAARSERRAYEAVDDADRASARPDFAILIYPGGILDRQDRTQLSSAVKVAASTPPTFVAVASDDRGSVDGSVRYWQALKEAGVKSELHVYAGGGHGFGIRPRAGSASTWPQRAVEWLRGIGMLPTEKEGAAAR